MIFYFSGTGNSLHVSRLLADELCEKTCPITAAGLDSPTLRTALVFPVHAWGIPRVVREFIADHANLLAGSQYVFAVMTCGDDVGYADRMLDASLRSVCGRAFDAVFSVQMPNTYVCLPGFDVDADETCRAKLAGAQTAVKEIAACVTGREKVRRLTRGSFPWTKTYILRPLFDRCLVTDRYFRADKSRCILCGKCQASCPVGNIILDGLPQWQSHCTGCLACYHACPTHAVNFGSGTKKKGQYKIQKYPTRT